MTCTALRLGGAKQQRERGTDHEPGHRAGRRVRGGWFYSNAVRFGSVTVPSLGAVDGFVGKIVDSGMASTFAWVKSLGGAMPDFASTVTVQGNSVYVGNFFEGPATFGSTTATSLGTSPLRRADVYVAKLLDAGHTARVQWAQTAGGPATDAVNALAKSGTRHHQRPHRRGGGFLPGFLHRCG